MKALYRCIVKCGHAGSGNSIEREVRVRASSITEALRKAKYYPGVKKGALCRSAASVLLVMRTT